MPLYTTISTAKYQSNILHRGSENIFLKNQREDSLSPGPCVLHHTVPTAVRLQHCWTGVAIGGTEWSEFVLQLDLQCPPRAQALKVWSSTMILCERDYYKEDGFIEGVVLKRYGDSAPHTHTHTHTPLLPSHHEASSFLNMLLLLWHLLLPQTQK